VTWQPPKISSLGWKKRQNKEKRHGLAAGDSPLVFHGKSSVLIDLRPAVQLQPQNSFAKLK
jgi:hypothetical protein